MRLMENTVKTGTFLYADEVRLGIRIVRHEYRPGTGDPFDEPQIREDLEGTFYEIQYGSTTARENFVAGGGYFDPLEKAVQNAEVATNRTVLWSPEPQ